MATLDAGRRRLIGSVGAGAAGLAAVGLTWTASQNPGPSSSSVRAPLRALLGQEGWLNTDPLREVDLSGKTVLVNFWTYSCINSLRTLPYLRAWATKYRDRGLVIVGVHTPEFRFEHDLDRVRRALVMQGVTYPVVLDNDYAIWSAFGNEAWPGFFVVDVRGRVRGRIFGEEQYAQLEELIQELLSQAAGASVNDAIVQVAGEGAQAAPDWRDLQSPETYVGYDKASHFTSPTRRRSDERTHYEAAQVLSLNHWTLGGDWTVGNEYATAEAPLSAIRFRFQARDLHMVLGRGAAQALRVRVTVDGASPGEDRGVDVDVDGAVVLDEDRMYQLVRQRREVRPRDCEVTFLDRGARAYVFTFG